jgi:uncharacterized membrane protein YphA (DoxX/SURF4 family)
MAMDRLNTPFWALRLGLGLAALLAGLDKFVNLLAAWEMYLSPVAARLLPVSPSTFMGIVGVIEIVVGAIVLAGRTREGGYILAVWLLAIAINLVSAGRFFDVAVRDVLIALAAFALARMTEARAIQRARRADMRAA